MTIKSTRQRGAAHPRLAQALEHVRNSTGHSTARLAQSMHDWATDNLEVEVSLDGLRGSLKRLKENKFILPKTANLIEAYLASEHLCFLPASALEEDFLDLDKFFFKCGSIKRHGPALEGLFQTYAKSTSVERPVCRRGSLDFKFNSKKNAILAYEKQHRPEEDGVEQITLEWEGYCTPVGNMFVAVMRTRKYYLNTTPLLYIFWDIKFDAKGRIISMNANSIGVDPERDWPTFPKIYIERVRRNLKVIVDFVDFKDLPPHISRLIHSTE